VNANLYGGNMKIYEKIFSRKNFPSITKREKKVFTYGIILNGLVLIVSSMFNYGIEEVHGLFWGFLKSILSVIILLLPFFVSNNKIVKFVLIVVLMALSCAGGIILVLTRKFLRSAEVKTLFPSFSLDNFMFIYFPTLISLSILVLFLVIIVRNIGKPKLSGFPYNER